MPEEAGKDVKIISRKGAEAQRKRMLEEEASGQNARATCATGFCGEG